MRSLGRQTVYGAAVGLVLLVGPAASRGAIGGVGVGDRIRLKASQVKTHFYGERVHESKWITGTVVFRDGQLFRLKLSESPDTVSVPRDSIVAMEKSLGIGTRKGEGKVIGMVVGAVVGGALGVAIAYSPELSREGACEPRRIGDPGCAASAFFLGAAGIVVGGWGGRKLGGAIGDGMEHEVWERVGVWGSGPSLSVGYPSVTSGFGASLVFRF